MTSSGGAPTLGSHSMFMDERTRRELLEEASITERKRYLADLKKLEKPKVRRIVVRRINTNKYNLRGKKLRR